MSAFEQEDYEILDATELGYIRTILARERTYLVFLRTLAMFAGLTILIKKKVIYILVVIMTIVLIAEYNIKTLTEYNSLDKQGVDRENVTFLMPSYTFNTIAVLLIIIYVVLYKTVKF
tara:strand:- start:543 stop:896 length:354 start_codon:yes stop_codon:yes gene_type:complete